jgi:hypothetical protein
MKLKSSTVAMLAIAFLTAGGVYVWDQHQTQQTKTKEDQKAGTALFALQEKDIMGLRIQTKDRSLALERSPQGWQLKTPKMGLADDATVSFLLNLLSTGRSERSLSASPAELKDFGLDQPAATLEIQLQNQKTHQLLIGAQTFNQSGIYARIDPFANAPGQKVAVAIVPTSFLETVNRPLSDWQAKPKSSSSPSASPSSSTDEK